METPSVKHSLQKVDLHPIVLLSVTDHYNRVAKDTKKRVVGCLLGSKKPNGILDVTNSFAVPFDEEDKSPATWFLDYNFLEDLAYMFRRVNARERIVGWYSSGPKLKKNDIDIHKLFYEYTNEPVCCIINVTENTSDLPTEAYVGKDIIQNDGKHIKEFAHIPCSIEASEAEEVGIEHLLREIQDISLSTLTTETKHKLNSINGLLERLTIIQEYLNDIYTNKLPINQTILRNLQLIFNYLPNLNKMSIIKPFMIKTNDIMVNIYIASMIRSILALDNLLDNKINNKLKEDKFDEERREKQQQTAGDQQLLLFEKNMMDDTKDKDSKDGKDKKDKNEKDNKKDAKK